MRSRGRNIYIYSDPPCVVATSYFSRALSKPLKVSAVKINTGCVKGDSFSVSNYHFKSLGGGGDFSPIVVETWKSHPYWFLC